MNIDKIISELEAEGVAASANNPANIVHKTYLINAYIIRKAVIEELKEKVANERNQSAV